MSATLIDSNNIIVCAPSLTSASNDFSALEKQYVVVSDIYKRTTDFLSAYRNRVGSLDGVNTAEVMRCVNIKSTTTGMAMIRDMISFAAANPNRTLTTYSPKLHRSFQLPIAPHNCKLVKKTSSDAVFEFTLNDATFTFTLSLTKQKNIITRLQGQGYRGFFIKDMSNTWKVMLEMTRDIDKYDVDHIDRRSDNGNYRTF